MTIKVSGVRCQVSGAAASRVSRRSAFTMVEIALCLAIIGFALVAIIGVLPTGLSVQRENREETIINQEASIWLDALRSGSHGYDDLTNYVLSITNFWKIYDANTNVVRFGTDGYTLTNSAVSSATVPVNTVLLNNGARIIGLMSTPKFIPVGNQPIPPTGTPPYQSNYVVAYARAMSGAAVEKVPQTNDVVLENGFTYKLIAEIVPYVPFDTNMIDLTTVAAGTTDWINRSNNWRLMTALRGNASDIRLTFRWPMLPNHELGRGWRSFRVLNTGTTFYTRDQAEANQPLYYFQSSTYAQVTNGP